MVSVWKMVLFFVLFIVQPLFHGHNSGMIKRLFDDFKNSFIGMDAYFKYSIDDYGNHSSSITIFEEELWTQDLVHTPVKVWAIQIASAFVMYIFGKFACKFHIQHFSFALPMVLIMPVTIAGVFGKYLATFFFKFSKLKFLLSKF